MDGTKKLIFTAQESERIVDNCPIRFFLRSDNFAWLS